METLLALLIALINLSVQYLFFFLLCLDARANNLLGQRFTYSITTEVCADTPAANQLHDQSIHCLTKQSAWWFPKQTHLTLVDTTSLNKSVHLITQLLQVMRLHRGISNEPLGSCHSPRMDKPKKISPTEEWSPRQQK